MNLFILRHGLAVEPGTAGFFRDAERPLTSEGRSKLKKSAEAMKALELSFDLILSSPYVRARQTAELVAQSMKCNSLELTETLAPDGRVEKLISLLNRRRAATEDVLLVGHEPYLSELISLLVSGEVGLPVVMKKGGLCKLSAESLRAGRCATLEWLVIPKHLLLMA
jgi:phosphohistidine phosphatase